MDPYDDFQTTIYKQAVDEWSRSYHKLTFRIHRKIIDKLMKDDPSVTMQNIISDFKKYPLIREVFISNNDVILLPK